MQELIKLSRHARQDRVERLSRIIVEVGIGHTVFEYVERDRTCQITSTGVLMVYSTEDSQRVLLTAYLLTMKKAGAVYRYWGYNDIPRTVVNTINKNKQKHRDLFGF